MAAVQDLAERVKSDDKTYVDTDTGKDDKEADGSEAKPFKTLGYAYIQNLDKPAEKYQLRASETGALGPDEDPSARLEWKEPSKSAAKKAQNLRDAHKKKLQKEKQAAGKLEEMRQQRLKNLEEAKKVKIEEDSSLPKAQTIKLWQKDIALGDGETKGTRVKIFGRIHRLRVQKHATFITLKDGYGQLQCVLAAGPLTSTHDALLFAQETSLWVYGELRKLPEGATAPDSRELQVDYYQVFGAAPTDAEAITNRVSAAQDMWEAEMLDQRHLVLRGDNASAVMKIRALLYEAFVIAYKERRILPVSPPAFVQTQVEGGSTLFPVKYFGEEAYLTQSSQLYLETCLPSMGDVYCIEKSFRAEKSLTRRHLSGTSTVVACLVHCVCAAGHQGLN